MNRTLRMCLSGASVLNYRLTEHGLNPYPIPMLDGALALQFLRFNATEYNLDKAKFAATGNSAGGCMLMWLGFHPDLAQPDHDNPVLREPSRLQVLAPGAGQSCLHLPTVEAWFGVESLAEHPGFRAFFGLPLDGEIVLTGKLEVAMWDASPISYLSVDDPPIFLRYARGNDLIDETTDPSVWVHHPMSGIKLKERMDAMGLECYLSYPSGPVVLEYASQEEFIIRKLTEVEPSQLP